MPHGTSSLSVTESYLALPGGPGGFPQGFTCPIVLGNPNQRDLLISPTGLSPTAVYLSRIIRLSTDFLTLRMFHNTFSLDPTTPAAQQLWPYKCRQIWAIPLSLAATEEIDFSFFSSEYLDVSLPRVRFPTSRDDSVLPEPGCPIRKSTDLWSLAPSRGLSQLAASFIASLCQGIHH